MVGISLYVSNEIVKKVSEQERNRVTQWADAIKKKAELVRLTNRTFSQLREKERYEMEMWIDATKEISKPISGDAFPDYTLPLKIINKNKAIPVILFDNHGTISGDINLGFDEKTLKEFYPSYSKKQIAKLFDDSLRKLANEWKRRNPAFTIEVFEGLSMTYVYNDSKQIFRLEQERDSLINSFNQELISNKSLVPVILKDSESDSIISSNLPKSKLSKNEIGKTLAYFKMQNTPIELALSHTQNSILYYDDSPELKQLQYFPYIQFLIIGLFIFIGYLIFSTFRKAEQNQVWAGMAKETAHQLGTPLSSLMAWVQLLEDQNIDQNMVFEMKKDVNRLETVSTRFSKIGSDAKLELDDIVQTLENVTSYLRTRISSKITLELHKPFDPIFIKHNPPLMEWVFENIIKNAVDAIDKNGRIDVSVSQDEKEVFIDIKDSGKGIPNKQLKTVFQPGFTSKKRGWGLGLSLVKRIVSEYHRGKVFVLESEVNKGTTFRITLRK
ncbi:MAG: HAMP domain-containing sensor histidine kinase [Bacteroidota bacterium]